MKERVLITGASGFVGYHLITRAVEAGLEVYAAIRPSSDCEHLRPLPVEFVTLSLSDPQKLKRELEEKQFSFIIHGAGLTKAKTQEQYNYVNAELSRNLAQAALEADIPLKKFVFISSLAALGPLPAEASQPICPDSKPGPVTGYGRSKLLAEQYLNDLKDLPLVTLRPTAVYGPRERDIFIIIRSIAKGIEPYIGTMAQKLSFIYVKDLADIVIAALALEKNHVSYNVSDGNIYSKYALADLAKKALNKKTFRFHLPLGMVSVLATCMEAAYRFSKKTPALNKEKLNELNAANWSCSISELEMDLGFKPRYNLEKGMEETIRWYRQNKWI